MAGTGDFFADEYAQLQRQQMPYYYGDVEPLGSSPCQLATIATQPVSPCGGQGAHAYFDINSMVSHHGYGQPVASMASSSYSVHPQTPYTTNGAYVPSSHHGHSHGLRGKSKGFEPHVYGTLGYVNYETGEKLHGTQARLGLQLGKHFGVEAEGSLGISDEDRKITIGAIPINQNLGIKNSVAGFGVVRVPLFSKFSSYGRLGYHRTEIDQEITTGTADPVLSSFAVEGMAYGGGLEYAFNPRTALRVDYTIYDFEGKDSDALAVALSRKF